MSESFLDIYVYLFVCCKMMFEKAELNENEAHLLLRNTSFFSMNLMTKVDGRKIVLELISKTFWGAVRKICRYQFSFRKMDLSALERPIEKSDWEILRCSWTPLSSSLSAKHFGRVENCPSGNVIRLLALTSKRNRLLIGRSWWAGHWRWMWGQINTLAPHIAPKSAS